MLLRLIDQKIRRAFSNAALQYEALAGLQKEIGRELVGKLNDLESCQHILDVGMGTGYMTNRLSLLFPDTTVIGMDIADGMVASARQKYETFKIIQADAAQLPFKDNVFDVIASNLAYQWVDRLEEALGGAYRCLKNPGIFCVTVFGRKTLEELFASLQNTFNAQEALAIQRLPSENDIRAHLQSAGFQKIDLETEVIKVHFEDMWTLVKWLKDIGANILEKDFFVGRDRLLSTQTYYEQHFKDEWGIFASFEILWIKARK